ncbi:MAG: carboxypeptidase-like regulatory domain-containing protein [Acidobacteriia bacterium]|nr:carboxypeptidase-like regulatory domain-containing protein [Terriglobia bacterium]
MCLGKTKPGDIKWTANYVMGPAGRVLADRLPKDFSCRVTLNGRALDVITYGGDWNGLPWPGPKWAHPQHAFHLTITVDLNNRGIETVESDYWSTTNDPSQFSSYVQDVESGELISNVTVTALRAGVTTTTDENGLFTLAIPASYWKGKSPPGPLETLMFSKPGYRLYEYRNFVLHPGVIWLDIFLEKGTGTVVRKNRSAHDGGTLDDEFLSLREGERESRSNNRGEIFSLNIEPAVYEGGWIMCKERGAKAIVKARNLKSVDIFWYSTGTGIGEMPPAKAGPMKKVSTSADGDTWEIEVPDLMATNFWAQGIDLSGKVIKSMDLGNVGWNIGP